MPIKTLDLRAFTGESNNLYESVVIVSKRAQQIAKKTKEELDEKLSYFEGFDQNLEEGRPNEDQVRISLEYERQPKPAVRAINEVLNHEIYYRNPHTDDPAV